MKTLSSWLIRLLLITTVFPIFQLRAQSDDNAKLRIIVFGAHPDDAELDAGGVAALWAAQGHAVKFVSMTNGDVGHFRMAGGPLAQRRLAEVQECARLLGIETQVLDIHDGRTDAYPGKSQNSGPFDPGVASGYRPFPSPL